MDARRTFALASLITVLFSNLMLLMAVYVVGDIHGRALGVFGLGLVLSLLLWFMLQPLAKVLHEAGVATTPEAFAAEKAQTTTEVSPDADLPERKKPDQ